MSTLALPSLSSPQPSRAPAAPAAPTPVVAAPMARPMPDLAWQPARRSRAAALVTLGLHLLLGLALLQAGRTVVAQMAPAPLQVSLLQERQRPPEPPPARQAQPQALPVQPVLAVALPEFETAAPSPRAVQVMVQAAAPAPAAAPSLEAPSSTPQIAPQPPQPKTVAASALRYRVEPAVEVPLLSRRAGEHGRVALRVVFDPQGRPRDIQLQRSSGFARLDAQALEAMKVARITPIVENGRAIEVMAVAWLEYELD
ncbi:MAG: TonB family protein [Inhella sp.]